MTTTLAAAGGGAPVDQLAAVAAGTSLLTLLTLWVLYAHRAGGARPLRLVEKAAGELTGIPGWAAVPGIGAIACALVTIWGATWDIGLHIDVGRDEGPLGTAAHYPLLLGLFGTFLMGVLAIGIAPRQERRASLAAFRVPGLGPVPAAAVLLLAGGSFAMLAFPLDDLWHRVFGQDVTLWGPTHTMIITGTLAGGAGACLLLVEGARAVGRDPFGGRGALLRPLPAVLGGIFLYLWAASTHEFNWGVPQYRQVWQPLILAFGSGQALVLARVLGGRGGALAALLIWLPMQVAMSLVIGGPLHVTTPALPLFAAEALLIEAIGLRGVRPHVTRFGVLAGLAAGTLGFAAEYGWSQLVMPIPWDPALIPEGLPVAAVAGVAGGVLGALMAQALRGTLAPGRGPLLAALAAAVAIVGLGLDAQVTDRPEGVTATLALTDERQGPVPNHDGTQPVADLAVSFSRPELAQDANWVYALGWQGRGRFVDHLRRGADGVWRSTEPVPVGGRWKTFVRIHKGRAMLSVPVRMAPDAAIGFAGFPARPRVTRAMGADTTLLQIERKDDAPMGLWVPATILVLLLSLSILTLMAYVSVRLGRTAGGAPRADPPSGLLLLGAEWLLDVVDRRPHRPLAGSRR